MGREYLEHALLAEIYNLVVFGNLLLRAPGHLEHGHARRWALVEVDGAQRLLVHARGRLVVRHEHQPAQVGPLVHQLLGAAHHPRREAPALVLLEDEDVGEVCEGDVVGDDAGEADHLELGALPPPGDAVLWGVSAGITRTARGENQGKTMVLTVHVLCRLRHPVQAQRQAVVEHLAHLRRLERVVPPHQVGAEDVVDDVDVEIGLVGSQEEIVPVPGARLALWLLRLAPSDAHCHCWFSFDLSWFPRLWC